MNIIWYDNYRNIFSNFVIRYVPQRSAHLFLSPCFIDLAYMISSQGYMLIYRNDHGIS